MLGPLFRSQQFQNDRTELVILIIPRVIDPEKPMVEAEQDRSRAIERNRDALGERVRPDVDEAYRPRPVD